MRAWRLDLLHSHKDKHTWQDIKVLLKDTESVYDTHTHTLTNQIKPPHTQEDWKETENQCSPSYSCLQYLSPPASINGTQHCKQWHTNTTVCGTDNTSTTECQRISHTDGTLTPPWLEYNTVCIDIRTLVVLILTSKNPPRYASDLDHKVKAYTWLIGGARAVLSILVSATSGIDESEQDALFAV